MVLVSTRSGGFATRHAPPHLRQQQEDRVGCHAVRQRRRQAREFQQQGAGGCDDKVAHNEERQRLHHQRQIGQVDERAQDGKPLRSGGTGRGGA